MPETSSRLLAAIMFTDMVGYTALMQDDEQRARASRQRQRRVLEDVIQRHHGTILQYYGDGTLSMFSSAIEATMAAAEIQHELQREPRVPLRIGIHVGDIVRDSEGVYGDGVNIASRVQSLSVPGAVLVSEKVHDELRNQPSLTTIPLGEVTLKNVRRPISIYALAGGGLVVPSSEEIRSQTPAAGRSIAVLPFVNMSTDAETEYFSDGMTEEILNALTRVEGLRVTSRTSSFAFKGRHEDIRDIGRKLNVTTVLEGSVRKAGSRVRITAQLINVSDGYHLWSDVFERTLEDIFELQDEIALTIANTLRQQMLDTSVRGHLVRRMTTNIDAYNLYLKAIFFWNKWTPDNYRKAIGLLEEAIQHDPTFAHAYAVLANCYVVLGATGQLTPRKAFPKAMEAAERAISLNDALAECHNALGLVRMFYQWDWEGAEQSFLRAIGINPGLADVHHTYGLLKSFTGNIDDALREITLALSLDPLSLPIHNTLAGVYFTAERFGEAEEHNSRILEMDPTFRAAKNNLGWLHLARGKAEEAVRLFQETQRETGDELKGVTTLGFAYARSGRREEALECVRKLQKRQEVDPDSSLSTDLALVYAGLDDRDSALRYLQQAVDDRLGGLVFFFTNPLLRNLRSDPRFARIAKSVGLSV
jgi:adenylate cyclase